MKTLAIIKYALAVVTIALLFVNWRIAIITFFVSMLFHVIPLGPHMLFRTLVGSLVIAGLIYMFIDYRIGVLFIAAGFLVAKFYGWGNQKNIEYYGQKEKLNSTDIN